MTYNTLTDQEKERIFAEDVLGEKNFFHKGTNVQAFHPLTNLNHAMLGVEKFLDKYYFELAWEFNGWEASLLWPENEYGRAKADTPNAAIVEACIRIKRPDSFEEQS